MRESVVLNMVMNGNLLKGSLGDLVRHRFFRNCVNPLSYRSDEIILLMVMAKVLTKSPFLDIDLRQNLGEQKPLS